MGPCKNPYCKSHGAPHPNCKCYGGMAEGGPVKHFCDSNQQHVEGCEYYAEGGDVASPTEEPGILDKAVNYVKDQFNQGGDNIHNAVEQMHKGNYAPMGDMAIQNAAATIGSTKPIFTTGEAAVADIAPGALQRVRQALGLADGVPPQEVMNAAQKANMSVIDVAQAQGAAGRPMPSATPKGSFRPKRMAEGGEAPPAAPIQDGNAISAANAAPAPAPAVAQESPGVPIYDISGEQPVFGHIHPDDVHEGVASGQYSLPKGSTAPVFSPDGQLGDISAEEAPEAFKNGYKYATPEAIEQHTYGSAGQQAIAGLEGAAKGVLGPLAPAAEIATGLTTGKDIMAREKANPWTHGVAEAATLVGGAVTGLGEGALIAKAGEHIAAKVLGAKAATTLAKIGAKSLSDATQMVIYQGGNEISKMIEGDPHQSVGSAAVNVGLSGILGAGVGAAFSTVNPLWKATVGDRAGKFIDAFKGRIEVLRNPLPMAADAIEQEASKGITKAGEKFADAYIKHGIDGLASEGLGTTIGGYAGHFLGSKEIGALIGSKAITPYIKSVLPGILKPVLEKAADSAAFKSASAYGLAVARGEAQMSQAAKSVFKSIGEVATGKAEDFRDRERLDAQIQKIQQDPAAMLSVGTAVGHYLPDHTSAMAAQTATAVTYLNGLRPKPNMAQPLNSKMPPDPVAKAKYNRALDIANQPLRVIDSIKSGRLTPHDIQTLHAVNPAAYNKLVQKLTVEMTEHVAKGGTVPYKTRQSLSLFMGMPLDSSMTPQSILAAQPKPPQNQEATPTTPPSRPKTSTASLSKMAKGARTSGQAREARGVARNN